MERHLRADVRRMATWKDLKCWTVPAVRMGRGAGFPAAVPLRTLLPGRRTLA